MATSTYMTFLMHKKDGSTYEKLIDIKTFPDLGGEPENITITTLSDRMDRSILGIQKVEAMTFECNYDHTEYLALKELEGKTEGYAVWFGGEESGNTVTPTGTEGKFSFDGMLSVRVTGGGVNEVRGMSISIAPSTVIEAE